MRRVLSGILGVVLSAALLLVCVAPASANNDPHRAFLESEPFELQGGPGGFCSFPVLVTPVTNREYAEFSALPNGSTVIKLTGSWMVDVSNETSGKAILVNAGGPGTFTISPDGTVWVLDGRGRGMLYAPNLTDFGFPSNVVAVAGPMHVEELIAPDGSFSFTSVTGHPLVLVDVCAALT